MMILLRTLMLQQAEETKIHQPRLMTVWGYLGECVCMALRLGLMFLVLESRTKVIALVVLDQRKTDYQSPSPLVERRCS